mmetsp:Transcript_5976/g.14806  ORF Transcript_5976/g.14806 Transcript_5976/m.14806 type:complete len:535 (-) Transcript_5976:2855-4459(-)
MTSSSPATNDNNAPSSSRYGSQTRTRTRSDSIPEHREIVVPTPTVNTTIETDHDRELESLLMRHSSPLAVVGRPGSAGGRRQPGGDDNEYDQDHDDHHFPGLIRRNSNSSPSPLRLNRPRSNPRNRTPMRYNEEEQEQQEIVGRGGEGGNQQQRIAIRPLTAGTAVGAHLAAGNRFRAQASGQRSNVTSTGQPKSRKQGPGRAKARRTKNSDFVDLAREVHGSGSMKAAEALLLGHAHASKHRTSLLDKDSHRSKAIERFYYNNDDGNDDNGKNSIGIQKQRFFDGELPEHPYTSSGRKKSSAPSSSSKSPSLLTPLERYHRIEPRLRNILGKACVNSFAASKVVNTMQGFLICDAYKCGGGDMKTKLSYDGKMTRQQWSEMGLLEPPTVTENPNSDSITGKDDDSQHEDVFKRKNPLTLVTRFRFDADSSTGSFHRLLLNAVCQFHGLKTVPSTMKVTIQDDEESSSGQDRLVTKQARVLTASGKLIGGLCAFTLVDFVVAQQQQQRRTGGGSDRESPSSKGLAESLATLKVQ